MKHTIIYTWTDEAPALATCSFLPIIKTFVEPTGIDIQTRDISLAGRILSAFPEWLSEEFRRPDDLAELGRLVHQPGVNIIKLPNISASVPQLTAAIRELQSKGFNIPDYPEKPTSKREQEIRKRYDRIKGSAVNPVLREGNSDRRAPTAVKNYAKRHPYSTGEWAADSKTHVSSMENGDFYGSEQSVVVHESTEAYIEFVDGDGGTHILKNNLHLQKSEVVDTAVMNIRSLDRFLEAQLEDARSKDVLFSIHLKATMMKVSDPVIFGRVVYTFLKNVFIKHKQSLSDCGVIPDNGIQDLMTQIQTLPEAQRTAIEEDILYCFQKGPEIAMVNSDRGITNLHVPSDIIIDASMPAAIRSSGRMWAPDGSLKDMKAVIPDRSYAGVYQAVIDYCKQNGALDPATLGTVSNVGLMAGKAEEYGSHDTTFIASRAGSFRLRRADGTLIMEQPVETGDIFRMCRVNDEAVKNWINLALDRGRETGDPVIFWLDERRAHDQQLIEKTNRFLEDENIEDLNIKILAPPEATQLTLQVINAGKNIISVTGNVLRDYLTDLFPILELGTSAKMLSIVPLLDGGRLFETGAGGSAPKHVQQFLEEGHLRWDSLGEFLALAESLRYAASVTGDRILYEVADGLDRGTEELLEQKKSPSRRTGEIDTRGSHFYLALYWAKALAVNGQDPELLTYFSELYHGLHDNEQGIVEELLSAQGKRIDLGGYYLPDMRKTEQAMRPSKLLNVFFPPH